ncbi:phosphate ABC transporter permease PstA [Mesoplasma corruscae]|uniref:Phosphate transport system permease protein PstA n=1 Tax=Mesoplasma corruscae TaxID=216874 RepID=A0A2S5RGH4_9MOLU|nr:phosphate ABC transporter permease PstA [Mesoplasma corruscae]PPE06439.1 phosphate ABC transporter permease [Mesoplasma corruscae]
MTIKNMKENNNFKIKNLKVKEFFLSKFFKYFIYCLTSIVLIGFVSTLIFIIVQSVPLFKSENFNLWKFLSGTNWVPGKDGKGSYEIGMIALMTLSLLGITMLFAVPLTIFTTLFISEYLSEKMQKRVMGIVKLLASVPSVIFGLFARDQIGSLFQLMGAPNNDNLLVAAVTMTFMAAPTMISLSYNAIKTVPEGYRLGSLALGISKEKTTFRIIRKSATPQIITAVILGMARVIGETMAIMMIAGNSTHGLIVDGGVSGFLFSSIRTLAATIGLEMTENSGATHKSALFAIGLILFIIVFLINLVILIVSNAESWKKTWSQRKSNIEFNDYDLNAKVKKRKITYDSRMMKMMISSKSENKFSKKSYSALMLILMWISTAIVISFTFWILGDVTIRGLIGLRSPQLFMSIDGGDGILAALLTTLILVLGVLIFAIPLALAGSIYLSEYANKKAFSTKVFRFLINLLASTPSIVFGIIGLTIFIVFLGLPFSILAASLTMTLVVMPMLISNFETSINDVPTQLREAAIGLGMGRTKVLFKVILPNAIEGIVTGAILAMAKIIGESAPIYLTLGTDIQLPTEGFLSQGTTLTTSIYMIVAEGIPSESQDTLYLLALITISFIIVLNFTAGNISSLLVQKSKKLKLNFKDKKVMLKNATKPSFKYRFMLFEKQIKLQRNTFIGFFRYAPNNIINWFKRNHKYRQIKKGKKVE